MRTTIVASVLAFAASALAQTQGYAAMTAPAKDEVVPAGQTYTIKWTTGKFTGPATVSLLGGNDPGTLVPLGVLGKVNVEKDSFSWAVDCSLGKDKTYGIKIADDATNGATFQYSSPFHIKAAASCGSSSSSSATGSSTSSSSGYPTKTPSSSSSSGYPVSTSSSYPHSNSTASSYPTVKPTSSYSVGTQTTPVVIVTKTSSVTASGTSKPSSTSSRVTVPTGAAGRTGAGLALGFVAAALAL